MQKKEMHHLNFCVLTGVGFELTHTLCVPETSLKKCSWGWRRIRLGHPAWLLELFLIVYVVWWSFCHFEWFKYAISLDFFFKFLEFDFQNFHTFFSTFWNLIFNIVNWSTRTNFVIAKKCNSRDASFQFLCSDRGRFWTHAHSCVTKFSIESSKSGPYTARLSKAKLLLILHCFFSWDTSQYLKASDRSVIRTYANICVPETSLKKCSWGWRRIRLGHPAWLL